VVCFFDLYFEGCNFLIPNMFWTIVSVSDAPRGEVQVLFGHKNKGALPLGLACPEC